MKLFLLSTAILYLSVTNAEDVKCLDKINSYLQTYGFGTYFSPSVDTVKTDLSLAPNFHLRLLFGFDRSITLFKKSNSSKELYVKSTDSSTIITISDSDSKKADQFVLNRQCNIVHVNNLDFYPIPKRGADQEAFVRNSVNKGFCQQLDKNQIQVDAIRSECLNNCIQRLNIIPKKNNPIRSENSAHPMPRIAIRECIATSKLHELIEAYNAKIEEYCNQDYQWIINNCNNFDLTEDIVPSFNTIQNNFINSSTIDR